MTDDIKRIEDAIARCNEIITDKLKQANQEKKRPLWKFVETNDTKTFLSIPWHQFPKTALIDAVHHATENNIDGIIQCLEAPEFKYLESFKLDFHFPIGNPARGYRGAKQLTCETMAALQKVFELGRLTIRVGDSGLSPQVVDFLMYNNDDLSSVPLDAMIEPRCFYGIIHKIQLKGVDFPYKFFNKELDQVVNELKVYARFISLMCLCLVNANLLPIDRKRKNPQEHQGSLCAMLLANHHLSDPRMFYIIESFLGFQWPADKKPVNQPMEIVDLSS